MDSLTSIIDSYFHEPHASLINGILLGRKLNVTNAFYTQLKTVGLIHIVVLSGMNITILSAIVMNTIVKYIGKTIASIITVVTIICFVIFVGTEAPIVRASIMGILSIVGLAYGRKTIPIYILILSAIIMIIINKDWISSISFQLSFAATFGIILFGSSEKPENKLLAQPKSFEKIKSYIFDELRISLSAQIFTVPIIFLYFRQISLVSPLTNILVAWLIAPIMLLGIIMLLISSIWRDAGFVFSLIIYPLLEFIVVVTEVFSKMPLASIKI